MVWLVGFEVCLTVASSGCVVMQHSGMTVYSVQQGYISRHIKNSHVHITCTMILRYIPIELISVSKNSIFLCMIRSLFYSKLMPLSIKVL